MITPNPSHIEQMRIHIEEGGKLSHRNGLDLLAEIERLRLQLVKAESWKLEYDASRADIAENVRLRERLVNAKNLLREARQYVSDAGNDEDPETVRHAASLCSEIYLVLSGDKEDDGASFGFTVTSEL